MGLSLWKWNHNEILNKTILVLEENVFFIERVVRIKVAIYRIQKLSSYYVLTSSNRCVFTFLSWFNFLAFQQKWVRISEWVYSHMMGYCYERSIMYSNLLLTHIYMKYKKSFLRCIQKDLLALYTLIRIW